MRGTLYSHSGCGQKHLFAKGRLPLPVSSKSPAQSNLIWQFQPVGPRQTNNYVKIGANTNELQRCSVRICTTPVRPLNNMIILNCHNTLPRRDHLSDLANGQGSGRNLIRPLELRYYTQVPGSILAPTVSAPQAASPATALRHCTVC